MPHGGYAAGLPRKRVAAGVLFRSADGRVLLVEPSYKPNWEMPGGIVEADEAPWAGAVRELDEELGTDRPVGRLLVVDHVRAYDGRADGMAFVFDGGVLDDADVAGFVFRDGEILSAGLYTINQARTLAKPMLADRLSAALAAVREGVVALCQDGARVA
ncbi:8-oxo-dGTP pyrophosphatase MutT (NUDIX family) [Kribbella aluminosa]|uniref:8-oxo-dGTP pyrophosphatase MutT (NUDIX family) n=1 Tax=Kribbella aluminosa TaxID=416017 RepID=A0ABS4US19_9ACTN|nr:NUDIX hydrolase [Kribbella aluminosa]MBP2354421.1 8-oxo-dGTP pyrophosphatase MutT (NUDIX family) [Kribbella aluminosa]